MKICFLDNSPIPYNSNDIDSINIRGAENVIIHLSRELSRLNNDVYVFNNCLENNILENVKWSNLNKLEKNLTYDIAFYK